MASPYEKMIFDKKGSEKQISVDPISLRESEDHHQRQTGRANTSTMMMMYPVTTGPKVEVISVPLNNFLAKSRSSSKFMSNSLPSSATSSPKSKKKYKNHHPERVSTLGRQHSVALSNLERLRESHLLRSKSCGEGRACLPSVDFDLWCTTANTTDHGDGTQVAVDKEETESDEEEEEEKVFQKKGSGKKGGSYEEKFKCGACIFLPGFSGKGKTVRARKEEEEEVGVELPPLPPPPVRGMAAASAHIDIIVSQRMSLEKFECGSWRSSAAIMNYEDDEEDTSASNNLFFDLPVELIRYSNFNDTESPVTTGFVFDNKDQHQHQQRKGVLKNTMMTTTTTATQPNESCSSSSSSRHVRFSTSSTTLCPTSPTSPSCVTPRLLKARDDFNAFLEAQSA